MSLTKKNCLQEYLHRKVSYGGVEIAIGEVILDLQKLGGTVRMIDMYLVGLDTKMSKQRRVHERSKK